MNKSLSATGAQLMILIQATVLVLALALIFIPECRSDTLRVVFKALFFLQCVVGFRKAVRRNYLRKTAREIFEDQVKTQRRVSTSTLERVSDLCGFVALVVLTFS